MLQILVSLEFFCHACEELVQLKVHCSGEGLKAGPRAVAAVQVSCPHCQAVNQVCFRTTGEVVLVRPVAARSRVPAPSLN